jgi:LysW-gamma-L-lysine carboxypeptidase
MSERVELLTQMLNRYSPSGEEEHLVQFLGDEMKKMGFQVKVDCAGNLVGEVGKGEILALFCGHLDTVPGEVPVKMEGGRLYGRGAVDAKGPLAAMIFGALDFAEVGAGKVLVVGFVEEESTGKGVRDFVKDRLGLRVEHAIFGEPSGIDRITIGYRGRVQAKVICKTSGGHAGAHWLYKNAVEEAYNLWLKIRKGLLRDAMTRERFNSISACLTKIRGGIFSNVVPNECELVFDVRVPPSMTCRKVMRLLEDLVQRNAPQEVEVETRIEDKLEPFKVDSKSLLVQSLRRAIRDITERTAVLTKKTGSSDMVLLKGVVDTIVAYGPGDPRLEHTVNEYIDIAEYLMSIRVYKRVLEVLLEHGE